jgi:predicted transcriptional regulator
MGGSTSIQAPIESRHDGPATCSRLSEVVGHYSTLMNWLTRFTRKPSGPFGPLEWRVLVALWDREGPASVRDLHPAFPETAYTTLMTTLDRLRRKGVLDRTKHGRAFYYRPCLTRPEFEAAWAADAFRVVLAGDSSAVGPLLSFFVDAVGDRDHELLDELEALVRSRQAEIGSKRS